MNMSNKKFYIISLTLIVLLGIIAGILIFNKKDPKNEDYNYQGRSSRSFTVNDLTKKEKELAGVDLNVKLEDRNLYSEQYKKYLEASDEKKKESEVVPAKYDVPYEVIDDIKDDLDGKDVIINTDELELDPDTGLPVKFNLKDVIDIKIEDQGRYGLCWDFASMKSLETYLALNNLGNYDFSEIHVDYLESNLMYYEGRDVHDGGNFNIFQKYINEFGVVDESQAPYREHTEEEYYKFMDMPKTIEVTETVDFPSMYQEYEESDEDYAARKADFRRTVKEHILKNGGLYASINATDGLNLYVPPDDEEIWWANHAITIVGWDDTYSKDNFTNWNNGHTPEHDGAYIALNSWGPYANDNGYFYISYEDKFVERCMSGIASTSLNDAVKVSAIQNSVIRNYLTEKYGHLFLESNGEKYITKAILGSITELDLSGRGLTSLDGIDLFEELYYLDVSDNNITDISGLKDLKRLGHLDLSNNPISNISALTKENLPNVYYIDLSNTKIGNVASLANLPDSEAGWVTFIFANDKGISGYEELINNTKGYIEIDLSGCGLTSFPVIQEGINLSSLNLANNNITSGLENMPNNMSYLDLSGNGISDVSSLEGHVFSNLILENNNITELPKIYYDGYLSLDLSGNPITNYDFLGKIERKDIPRGNDYDYDYESDFVEGYGYDDDYIKLSLDRCNLTDISFLNNLKQREINLSLKDNNITDLSVLNEDITNKISAIDLSGNKNLSNLSSLTNLGILTLKDCGISDLTDVVALKNLTSLDLANNNIKDITKLSELKELTSLSLAGNVGIEGTLNLKNLYILNLQGCDIDNDFNFYNLPDVYIVNIKNNPRFTQVSKIVTMISSNYVQVFVDNIDYEDYEKINNMDKWIYVYGATVDVNATAQNGQVDFSNLAMIKKLLMKNLSSPRIVVENASLTKKGFVVTLNNPNATSIQIYLNNYYGDNEKTIYKVNLVSEEAELSPEASTEPTTTSSTSPTYTTNTTNNQTTNPSQETTPSEEPSEEPVVIEPSVAPSPEIIEPSTIPSEGPVTSD